MTECWELTEQEKQEAKERLTRIEAEVEEQKKRRDERIVREFRFSDNFPLMKKLFKR